MNKEQLRKELEGVISFIKDNFSTEPNTDASIILHKIENITTRLAALDDGDGPKEYYIPIPVTKFGDLPTPMEAVVVFFKNRKEPWVAYREIDNIWFFESGESCKTPTHWLKKIKK